jgi:uncharacterized protein (DUF2249 family)
MSLETELNVCGMPPRERHPKIFATWESIPVGGVMRLVNDHDPKPLYYEFSAERGGEFEWNYLEKGPERWAVAIKRIAPGNPDAAVPESKCGCGCRHSQTSSEAPAWAARAPDQIVDVREDLRKGLEPFGRIMAAVNQIQPGQTLQVRAIFEPVPLYAVLEGRGFEHSTERLAADDWQVTFLRR